MSTEIEIRPTTTESTGMKNKSVEIPDSLRFLILGLEGSFLVKSNGSAKPSKNFLLLRSYSIVNNRRKSTFTPIAFFQYNRESLCITSPPG